MEEIIHKLDFIKIKNFCSVKYVNRMIRHKWEKIFAKDTFDKEISKIYKELLKLKNKKTNNPV